MYRFLQVYKNGFASDFNATDNLYRSLKLGPYAYLREWTVKRLWTEYGFIFQLGALLLLLWAYRTLFLASALKKRTEELQKAFASQKLLEKELSALQMRLSKTERALHLTQISSIVAHELSQPAGGVLLYLRGIKNGLKKMTASAEAVQRLLLALEKAEENALRVSEIIDKVRSYGKKTSGIARTDLSAALPPLLALLSSNYRVAVQFEPPNHTVAVRIDGLELELIVSNIFKNTARAVPKEATLSVELFERGDFTLLRFADNGAPISEKALERMRQPLFTSKEDGLGLGLKIVASVLESHGGRLDLQAGQPAGLVVTFYFPKESR